jgi:hypothetical protein
VHFIDCSRAIPDGVLYVLEIPRRSEPLAAAAAASSGSHHEMEAGRQSLQLVHRERVGDAHIRVTTTFENVAHRQLKLAPALRKR